MKETIIKKILLLIYGISIIYLTLLNRTPEPERMAWLTLFGSYRRAWIEQHEFILWGLIDNVFMLIPLGILLPWIWNRCKLLQTMGIAAVISVTIECIQYITKLGYFDVDDIWNNLWGTLIGYGIYQCFNEIIVAKKEKRGIRGLIIIFGLFPLVIFGIFFMIFLKIGFENLTWWR